MPIDPPTRSSGRPRQAVSHAAPTRGRPANPPLRPGKAFNGIEDFKFHDEWIVEHMRLRDLAFEKVVRSGMTTYQIAQALGVPEGSVRYWAKCAGLTHLLRKVKVAPPAPRKVLERQAEKPGSVLFG